MTNQINDWDVMQSGYNDEQLYPEPKQFNLTIEQMRQILDNAPDGAQMWRNMDSVCSPNEILYYAWFGGALLVFDEGLWGKSIYHTGKEYILDQLEMLSDLQKYLDQYTTSKPKQQLEVLDMHDVPCTTQVYELPIQPNFPKAILDAERKCGANHG